MEEGHWDLSKVDYNEVEKSQATLVYGQTVSYTHLDVYKRQQIASTKVTAILPVIFAPPGKKGINPIRLLIRIKTVS